MSGNDSARRRSAALRTALLVLVGLALLGGAGWKLLRSEHKPGTAAAAGERGSGSGATVVVQAPGISEPGPPPSVAPAAVVEPSPSLATPPPLPPAVEVPTRLVQAAPVVAEPTPPAPEPPEKATAPAQIVEVVPELAVKAVVPAAIAKQPPKAEPNPPAEVVEQTTARVERPPVIKQAPKVAPEPPAKVVEQAPAKVETPSIVLEAPKVVAEPPAELVDQAGAKAEPAPTIKQMPAEVESSAVLKEAPLVPEPPARMVEQAPVKAEPPPVVKETPEAAPESPAKLAQHAPAKVEPPAELTQQPEPQPAQVQLATRDLEPVVAAAAAKQDAPPVEADAPALAPPADAPSFDIVRISPQGDAVVAGRAAPNADVRVLDNGREIGRTQADDSGQWVILPDKPLASGGQELTLAAREQGKDEVVGDAPVVLLVPGARPGKSAPSTAAAEPGTPATPLAVLTPPDAPPKLLQAPVPIEPTPAMAGKIGGKVGLDVVDYDDRGAIRFAGSGAPGSKVRLYVDDVVVGDAIVDPQGRWGLMPTAKVAVGDHRLRVDDLGISGQVTARVELPFQRALLSPEEVLQDRIVVQPRQNLWRLARRAYGLGTRYTVIYEANRDQIRNPDLIYPGQVFAIPSELDGAAPVTSASTSSSASTSR